MPISTHNCQQSFCHCLFCLVSSLLPDASKRERNYFFSTPFAFASQSAHFTPTFSFCQSNQCSSTTASRQLWIGCVEHLWREWWSMLAMFAAVVRHLLASIDKCNTAVHRTTHRFDLPVLKSLLGVWWCTPYVHDSLPAIIYNLAAADKMESCPRYWSMAIGRIDVLRVSTAAVPTHTLDHGLPLGQFVVRCTESVPPTQLPSVASYREGSLMAVQNVKMCSK